VIVDTSALIAILWREPEADAFLGKIHDAPVRRLSVAGRLELAMVVERLLGPEGTRAADLFLERAEILLEPVTLAQGTLARRAFLDYGKGRHPAGLNFGDCFAYALAKERDEPLLFKGSDFSRTDVQSA